MKWSRSIRIGHPVSAVDLLPASARGSELAEQAARQREQQAYERGLQDGERRLGEQLLQQRTELQRLYTEVLEGLRGAIVGGVQQHEGMLVDIAFEVAGKVVDGLPIGRETIETNLRAALAEAEDAREIVVRLNPEDLEILRRNTSEPSGNSDDARAPRFVADKAVGRGGCLVQTEFGAVDARRESRWARLRQALDAPT